jgi:VCBS repeat-containing protein
MQDLLAQAQAELDLQQGEFAMLIPDMPNMPPQTPTIVMLAQTNQAQDSTRTAERILGVCGIIDNEARKDANGEIYPNSGDFYAPSEVVSYFQEYEHRHDLTTEDIDAAKTTILSQPKHGTLTEDSTLSGRYWYSPKVGYVGKDSAEILVEIKGMKVKVRYFFHATEYNEPNAYEDYCEQRGGQWKISQDANGTPILTVVNYPTPSTGNTGSSSTDTAASAYTLSASVLSTFSVDPSLVTFNLADLAGGAVGQAVGNTITLDTNAAGHNWFIDTTPWDNSEYLPTSNPYEWVAKEGTAAYGKMDMLSVLLHEYGHALGIDHSADNHDYMATTLTPGVRRMPSAEELALMQELVGQAKGEMVADGSTPTLTLPLQGGGDQDAPLPIPLGAGFGMAFIGRMRKSGYGGTSIDFASSVMPLHSTPQYAVAANATFANLATPAGWNSQGSVDITSGAATLNEVSTSQTRLSQVFMLNEQDRYLSFTLSGTALDDLNGAPDDAFEVALLDANTGANLLGSIGLTRTDAFLNLQADGTRHMADCVTCTDNPDGSRTYRVDLSAVDKNNAVNLSFDLLGFGQDNSHVTLSDIRVSGLPQLHDDAATLLEDNLLTFDPFAQADAALRPMLASQIVAAPTHGVLAMNADGTFAYTPDLDYFGTDSFSYRLSDGPLDSNLATVSLTVTPVNDAPVVADVALTTAEDTALVIDLYAYATDVDSTLVRAIHESPLPMIVTGPQHGTLVANVDGTYSYTPDANYFGADSFTYRVNDGELDSNVATVTLNITAVNDAPVAADTQAATDEDTPLNLDLLASASDVDGDVLTPVIIAGPLHGQLVRNPDGTFNYLSDLDYFGTDSFTYQVNDAQSAVLDPMFSGIVTVSLTINAVNDAPVAVAASVTGTEDTPYIFNWSDFHVSDVDSVDLAITINTLPADSLLQYFDSIQWLAVAVGQRVTRADIDAGWLCFGPDVNESGFAGYCMTGTGNNLQNYASFTYQADDGFLSSALASMTVNIVPVADAPMLALAGEVDAYGASALRFSTSWEIAPNRNPTFTILPQSNLDGWNAIKEAGDNGQGAWVTRYRAGIWG